MNHIWNLKLSSSYIRKKQKEVKFNNTFNLTYYIKNIMNISISLVRYFIYLCFVLSLKFSVYMLYL